ncbi:MAG TPA: glycosyltransferase [Alphaproteobacteria bacterium]|nr:glycosyltransferase [Alphaproteobacteria bacterium]
MKVLHAAETIKGGVATVMRALIEAQTKQYGASNVTALVPAEQSAELPTPKPTQKRTFARSGRHPLAFFFFARTLAQLVLRQKPHVVHLHSTFAGAIGRVILLALRPWHKAQVVYCPHAFAFMIDTQPLYRSLFAWVEWLLAPATSHIICVSEFEKNVAISYGLPERKLVVVHNGVNAPAAKKTKDPFKASRGHVRALFVGRFDHQKGFDTLQRAMAQLHGSPVHLTAVGGAVNGAAKPAQVPNITYTGWLPAAQVAAYMAHAHVIVVPSRYEGFAMVPLEAMAHGKAVLASNVTSLPEAVSHGKTGLLFAAGNAAALAGALRDTPLASWQTMGKAGFMNYQKHFTARRMAQATATLYGAGE